MDESRSFEPSETRNHRKTIMQVLTNEEIDMVFGGTGGGTPDKKDTKPKEDKSEKPSKEPFHFVDCVNDQKSRGIDESDAMINCTGQFFKWIFTFGTE